MGHLITHLFIFGRAGSLLLPGLSSVALCRGSSLVVVRGRLVAWSTGFRVPASVAEPRGLSNGVPRL